VLDKHLAEERKNNNNNNNKKRSKHNMPPKLCLGDIIIHYQGVHRSLIIYFQYFGSELIYFHCDGDQIVYFRKKMRIKIFI
jgi:hypothetical protein